MRGIVLATLFVRDEEDILAEHLEHHLTHGVDAFLVTDNGSVDGTPEILRRFRSHILEITFDPRFEHPQGECVTRMARRAWELGADWVVPLDADEFWYGLEHLHELPADVGVVSAAPLRNHPPVAGLVAGPFTRAQMPYYHIVPHVGRFACRAAHRLVITEGNHAARNHPGRVIATGRIVIHHYPVRSYRQFVRKVVNNGSAYERYAGPRGHGVHHRRWYALWRRGELERLYRDELLFTEERIARELAAGTLHVFDPPA
jgi:glycosyltransferase involved in cell wall biosynthesis